MKKRFKILVGSLALSTLISSHAMALESFLDLPKNLKDKEPIQKAIQNNIVVGYKGYIKPNEKLTKAEMVTILNRLFNTPKSNKSYLLKDISRDDWYYEEIIKAINYGIISPKNGMINPNESVNLEEVSAIFKKILDKQANELKLSDSSRLNVSVETLSSLVNEGNNKKKSKKDLKRSEFIKIIDNLVYKVIDEKGEFKLNDVDGNIIVKAPDVTIKNSKIEGNLILTKLDTTNNVLVLDNVKIKETIVLKPGQKLILKNGSKVNKVIVSGKGKEKINIIIEDNSKLNILVSDNKVSLAINKNNRPKVYNKEQYKNLPENKNKPSDPLLNDDYIIIEKPEDKGEVVQPEDKGEVVQPEDKGEVVQPEDKGEVVQPEDKGEVVQPEDKGEVVQPEDKGEVVKPEDKDEVVKPEDKDEVVQPEDKDEVVKPEDKGEVVKPEDEDIKLVENKKIEEIKARINNLSTDKNEIINNSKEVIEIVGLFNTLSKQEILELKEYHIILIDAMQVIQDYEIEMDLKLFINSIKTDDIVYYKNILSKKKIVEEKLELLNNISKPIESNLKKDLDFIKMVIENEDAYYFIVEIENLVNKNYDDYELLENREEVDTLVNKFLELDRIEKEIIYSENHYKLEDLALRLEKLLHEDLVRYLEESIYNLPNERKDLLLKEEEVNELADIYNYLVENNLRIKDDAYQKLLTSINYFVFKDAYGIKDDIEQLPKSVEDIMELEDYIISIKIKYELLEKEEQVYIGDSVEVLNEAIKVLENKDIYIIAKRIKLIPNDENYIKNYSSEIYKLIDELTPIMTNEYDKFKLISDEYKYLEEVRLTLETRIAKDIAEEIKNLPKDLDEIFLQKDKIISVVRKTDSLNAIQRNLIEEEFKILSKIVDVLRNEKVYNLKVELLNLPTDVDEIFANKAYIQDLISRYNVLSYEEMHMLSNEYKHLKHASSILSAERGYNFTKKIQNLPKDKDEIFKREKEFNSLVTEFNQLDQNDKNLVYGKDKELRYVADILASKIAFDLAKEINSLIDLDNIKKELEEGRYYEVQDLIGSLNEKLNDPYLYGKHNIKDEHDLLRQANILLINYSQNMNDIITESEEEKGEVIEEIEENLEVEDIIELEENSLIEIKED